ncbi:YdcF family protein [Arachidicoccus ginsenosidimutans]|uniref:YdcF family protein n=1 Tax=Arachidicoccus sp. BS20 TaxID=1850526 RepID=UPI0018D31743|nr:YdcF family protein [Arachidicoccus sp. BS20]
MEKRIFYLLYEMEKSSKIKKELGKDKILDNLYQQKISNLNNALNNCNDMQCLANALQVSDSENVAIDNALGKLYHQSKNIQSFVHNNIRASHRYELSNSLSDSLLLIRAWNEEAEGMNHIVNAYLLHKDLIYPTIDSAKYYSQSKGYFDTIKAFVENEISFPKKKKLNRFFFKPLPDIDLAILQLNGRNEAGRFEPVPSINIPAFKKVKSVDWNRYQYSSILVFGSGPGKETISFSKENQMRCDSAVALFKKGLAPFLIVSGGFAHPFMTHHCEAIEMRNYMVNKCGIPSNAVIIEPYARHTTTNIRNANRILIEHHFPLNKLVLGVSSKSHIDYITGEQFIKIFHRDIGFVPFTEMQRLSKCEASYLPAASSMQINSKEPLDP